MSHIRAIDFANRCETMADWLSGVGQPGDSVIIWATNCWQWAVMDIACQIIGSGIRPHLPNRWARSVNVYV